jgi:uncharacterized membrane protein
MKLLKDILGIVGKVAPTIAGAIGGPFAGTAVGALSDALFGNTTASEKEVVSALINATPDQLAAIKKADQDFALKMRELDIDVTKAYIADTSDARHSFGANSRVFWLGISILIIFLICIVGILYACYNMITGDIIVRDAGILATATGLIGSILGYVSANAQQVVGYYFGSSKGSSDKSDAIAKSITK